MTIPPISLIAAMAANRAIGINNRLPWHLPGDLRFFRETTMGKIVLMGRKTHASIGRPLPGRTNLVLTTNPAYPAPGCRVVSHLEEAFSIAGSAEIMVIGGASLYQECLPLAARLYLTLIHKEFAGDTFFPALDAEVWQEEARRDRFPDPESGLAYSLVTLVCRKNFVAE